jgi:hypothetical protein
MLVARQGWLAAQHLAVSFGKSRSATALVADIARTRVS